MYVYLMLYLSLLQTNFLTLLFVRNEWTKERKKLAFLFILTGFGVCGLIYANLVPPIRYGQIWVSSLLSQQRMKIQNREIQKFSHSSKMLLLK